MSPTREQREAELRSLAKSDRGAIVRLWQKTAGVPASSLKPEDIDLDNVAIPAILEAEFARPNDAH